MSALVIDTGDGLLLVVGGVAIVDDEFFEFGEFADADEFAAEFGGTSFPVVKL